MNDRLKRFYLDNRNSMESISISIDKKDFNSMSSTKTLCVNPKQNYIHWSEYFMDYLEKINKKKVKWANELITYSQLILGFLNKNLLFLKGNSHPYFFGKNLK